MSLSTPPLSKRGQSWTKCSHIGPKRPYDHAIDHALSTPGRSHQKPQFSAASDTLTTLTTPYIVNNRISGKEGGNSPVSERHRFSDRGVVTLGVVTSR